MTRLGRGIADDGMLDALRYIHLLLLDLQFSLSGLIYTDLFNFLDRFDSSIKRGRPFTFQVGMGQVIKGLSFYDP